jgi:hypothetical protein
MTKIDWEKAWVDIVDSHCRNEVADKVQNLTNYRTNICYQWFDNLATSSCPYPVTYVYDNESSRKKFSRDGKIDSGYGMQATMIILNEALKFFKAL